MEHIHCIGIGGIGVSALARLYQSRGWRVSGSDLARSEITDALTKEGIRVFIGKHNRKHILLSVTRVVYSVAVRRDNPELREARRRGIPAQTYAKALGELTRRYRTVAVAGAHGKSTTTALIALILARGGSDPTVIIGTKLREFGDRNFRSGRSPWLVLEADEYRASFLNYTPAIAVITNIDREHLDFYRSIRAIEATFLKFLSRLAPNGTAVLNRDDHRLRRIGGRLARRRPDIRVIWYSLQSPAARRIATVIRIPGRHNVANALAAHAAGRTLKIPARMVLAAIHAYRGAWRRFDYQGLFALRGTSGQSGAKVFADYAHHPTEIKATLQAAREKFPRRRIWCVFQPHHYERTHDLFGGFSRAFSDCDTLILLDIYEVAGRERKRKSPQVSSERLARAVSRNGTPAIYLANPQRLQPFLAKCLRASDILLMMGAGSIWKMTKDLLRPQKKQRAQTAQGSIR